MRTSNLFPVPRPPLSILWWRDINPRISYFLHEREAVQTRYPLLSRMDRMFVTGLVLMAVTVYLTVP